MRGTLKGSKFILLTLTVVIHTFLLDFASCGANKNKESRRQSIKSKPLEEVCTAKCEPEKCPNVGPIGVS